WLRSALGARASARGRRAPRARGGNGARPWNARAHHASRFVPGARDERGGPFLERSPLMKLGMRHTLVLSLAVAAGAFVAHAALAAAPRSGSGRPTAYGRATHARAAHADAAVTAARRALQEAFNHGDAVKALQARTLFV